MNAIIDIIGSTLIGGMIFLLIFKLNLLAHSSLTLSDSELKLQQNAKTLSEILNYDLRKVGYKYDSTAITIADTNRIKFYSDLDRNGTVDNLEFCVSSPSAVPSTQNPNDIVLYRVFNGDTLKGPSLGLRRILFTYLNGFGQTTTVPDSIKYIRAELWIESDYEIENLAGKMEYPFTYWEMTINPRNI